MGEAAATAAPPRAQTCAMTESGATALATSLLPCARLAKAAVKTWQAEKRRSVAAS